MGNYPDYDDFGMFIPREELRERMEAGDTEPTTGGTDCNTYSVVCDSCGEEIKGPKPFKYAFRVLCARCYGTVTGAHQHAIAKDYGWPGSWRPYEIICDTDSATFECPPGWTVFSC